MFFVSPPPLLLACPLGCVALLGVLGAHVKGAGVCMQCEAELHQGLPLLLNASWAA